MGRVPSVMPQALLLTLSILLPPPLASSFPQVAPHSCFSHGPRTTPSCFSGPHTFVNCLCIKDPSVAQCEGPRVLLTLSPVHTLYLLLHPLGSHSKPLLIAIPSRKKERLPITLGSLHHLVHTGSPVWSPRAEPADRCRWLSVNRSGNSCWTLEEAKQ